ncbi:MAG: ABC transporter ATP-binding protein [Vicinamibacterales bacterium]
MAAIALERLTKIFENGGRRGGGEARGTTAVEALDLTIADGERLVLVGPSGSGKSTVLRMIAGLEGPTSGRIRIDDRDVTAVPPEQRDLAMVFQSYALYPHKSVRQNLSFGLETRRVPRDEIVRRVAETAAALGLDGLLDRRPAALSGGQRQRVALGRAIVRDPRAFLFDEPLSNLDPRLRGDARAELLRLHARLGTTMVYVTHDQEEAMTLGQRIAVMRDGRLAQVAPPMTLYREPADTFVAGFIGSPPMNLIEGRLLGIPAATAGIRPQDVGLTTPADGVIAGRVEVIEPVGHVQTVHVAADDVRLVAVVAADQPVAPGDAVGS